MTTNPSNESRVRVVSFGGGVQSSALLALAAQGEIDYQTFLFANVGHDSESKATIAYMADVLHPYAASHGLTITELQRVKRDGTTVTLRGEIMKEGSRTIPIPMRMGGSGAPGNRSCTADFKIKVIGKELRRLGATKARSAIVALGISVDEIQRAKPGIDERMPIQQRTYPLLDLGLNRLDCMRIIADAGLPPAPKSACYFCPYHSDEAWRDLKRKAPEDFADTVAIEAAMNDRRESLGKDSVWMHRSLRPLDRSVNDDQQLPGLGDDCDSGYCFT